MSNSLQTNFDLSAVDIRGIMVSNKLVEVVSNAAKIMNVDLKCCQKIGENCVILKCKESECSFKLIYRKYSDNTFMLYASILVHSHVKSVKPQRNLEAQCDDASLTIPQNSDKNDYSNNANKENSNSLDINELDFTENLDINQMNENNELIKGCEEDKEMEDDDGDEMLNLRKSKSIDKKERYNEVNNKLMLSIKKDTNKCNDASITTMASEIQNSKEEKEIKRGEILNDESSADKIKEMYRDPTIDDEPDLNDSDVELYLEAQDMACSQNSIDCTNPIKSSKKSHKKFSTDPYGNEIDEDEKS